MKDGGVYLFFGWTLIGSIEVICSIALETAFLSIIGSMYMFKNLVSKTVRGFICIGSLVTYKEGQR